ncbi:MAG: hypothetical protein JRH09_18520 [Deltaproteobacteria bacterium]|nr:hypothetical protein [Deltaproteobacteria bacterium]
MVNKKNLITLVLSIVLVSVLVSQIFRLYKENHRYKSALSHNIRIETEKQEYSRNLNNIKDIIKANCSVESTTDIIRKTMEFVHDNSLHLIDCEHRKYAFDISVDISVVVNKLLLEYNGQENKKPHLSCGPRSFVMREVLGCFGITSRLIQVYSDEYDNVQGHRILEVFNPQEKKWEIWDPDYRVTYVDRYTKKPVDIMALVFGDINRIVPKNGIVKGWEETATEHLRENYFKAFSLERFDQGIIEGTMNTTIIVNRAKFNIDKIFSDGLTFEEWAVRHYQHPRLIAFPCDTKI